MNTTYANLNKAGREKFGKIFPDFKVPLVTILSIHMTIAGISDYFYFADYAKFNQDQKRLLAKFMNDERGIPRNRVEECVRSMDGKVPISAKYIDLAIGFQPRPF